MNLNEETRIGLGVALNEADLTGFAFDPNTRVATISLLTFALAEGASTTSRREIQLLLHPTCRIAASLRAGDWNDRAAAVLPVELPQLSDVVRACGAQPIYGWEFFDVGERELAQWGDRLSLDWRDGDELAGRHSFAVFQEMAGQHLDLCIWFDDLEVLDERGLRIPLEHFIADGRDWWQAFSAGSTSAAGHGLAPLDTTNHQPR